MDKHRDWLVSLLAAAVLLLALWIVCPVCFQNNDDKILMYLTAGYTTGTPEMGTVFGCFYYYGIICLLYRLFNGFAWYTIFELALIFMAHVVICHSFLCVFANKGKFITLTLYGILFVFSFMHFSTALQYTATAGLLASAAAVSLIVSQKDGIDVNSGLAISLILLVLSYGVRKQFGLVGLSAVFIILFFEIFDKNKTVVIKRGMMILTAFAIAFLSNAIYERLSGISDFNEYYSYAGTWIDYPHLDYYEDADGIYESVGWDETLYNAANNWFFMDENLTTEKFKVIVESYDDSRLSKEEFVERVKGLLETSGIVNIQVVIWIVSLVTANIIGIALKIKRTDLLSAAAMFLMFLALSIYFLARGRFPMRAYQALVFIFMVPSILLMLKMLSECGFIKLVCLLAVVMLVTGTVCYIKFPSTNMLSYTYAVSHDINRAADISKGEALEEYAISHPESIYIYDLDLALPASPFVVYGDAMPSNLMFWGGWLYNTPMYHKQVEVNGLEQLYAREFIDKDVYFCGFDVSDVLLSYMLKRYPNLNCEVFDEADGMVIYEFNE